MHRSAPARIKWGREKVAGGKRSAAPGLHRKRSSPDGAKENPLWTGKDLYVGS